MIGRTNSVPGKASGGTTGQMSYLLYTATFTPEAETCVIKEESDV